MATSETLIEKDDTRIKNFIVGTTTSKSFLELLLAESGVLEDGNSAIEQVINWVTTQATTAKDTVNTADYNYLTTLKRDLKCRYASRKALYTVACDQRFQRNYITRIGLYNGNGE